MLAYLFLSKIATLIQSNSLSAIFPYVHFCFTTGQEYWHNSILWQCIAIFAGIAVFVRLRHLNIITGTHLHYQLYLYINVCALVCMEGKFIMLRC